MGGGGKGGSAPPPPDPVATANAQGAANREASLASLETSMIGQNTPFGTLRYEKIGESDAGNPQYRAITELSPDQQQLLGLQTQGQLNLGNLGVSQLQRISDAVSQPFSYAGMPDAPVLNDAYIQSAKDSIINRDQSRMTAARDALITSLANQGITDPGSQAYITAIDELNRSQNDFALGADRTAFSEAAQRFGLDASARERAIQEAAYLRNQPLSEYSAFMGQSQPTMPTFSATPQYNQQPAPVADSIYGSYQGQLANYQADQAAGNATMGGLFGLGGSLGGAAILKYGLPFSDRRLKRNIERCGMRADGLAIYTFEYVWGEKSRGVMADEVEMIYPQAVGERDGFKTVNYEMIGGVDGRL